MAEITVMKGISKEFIAEQKSRIQILIDRKKDEITLAEENMKSSELRDSDKIKISKEIKRSTERVNVLTTLLQTIDNNRKYGTCLDCAEQIPLARLRSEPTATRCTACGTKHEKRN